MSAADRIPLQSGPPPHDPHSFAVGLCVGVLITGFAYLVAALVRALGGP